jgi:hypothetical protein
MMALPELVFAADAVDSIERAASGQSLKLSDF